MSEAIVRLRPRHIRMPVTDAEILEAQADFFTIAAFPRVIGAIDGIHIPIESPDMHISNVININIKLIKYFHTTM